MRNPTFARAWLPGILILASVVIAFTTPVNPWLIGVVTAVVILVVIGTDWLLRRNTQRRTTPDDSHESS